MKKLFLCILAVTLLCTWAIAGVEEGSQPSSISNKAPVIERAPLSQADLDKLEMIAAEQESPEVLSVRIDQKSGRSFAPGVMKADRPANSFLEKSSEIPEKEEYSGPVNIPDENVILQGGDDCASATVIPGIPFADDGTTTGYTDDFDEVCDYTGSLSPDVVYSYVPTADIVVNITLCVGQTNYDTKLYVYENTCASGTALYCNDDDCTAPGGQNFVSALYCVTLYAGNTYYIVVDGYGSNFGDYSIEITECGEQGEIECPVEGTLFGQPPTPVDGGWSLGTSELDVNGSNFNRFESYQVSGSITDVHWWGTKMVLDGSWQNCSEEPMTFEINFWADDGSGMPDISAPVCSYLLTAIAMPTGGSYSGLYIQYEFGVDLPEPCNLLSGWVSIQGMLDPSCWFMWASSDVGDGFSWFDNNGVFEDYLYDNAICLTGEYVQEFGACCDDYDGTCVDNVEIVDCPAPLRFAANTLCADLEPACGILGACCVGLDCIGTMTEAECDNSSGDWYAGETCPEFQCPSAPDNDLCENPDPITSPYPATGCGTNVNATVDCPGLLNWNTVWYEIELPYASNDVEITICAEQSHDAHTVGIILMDDCACDDYIIREDGLGDGWITCDNGFSGYNMIFPAVPQGPGTILWPSYFANPNTGEPYDFCYEVNVTDAAQVEYCDICYSNDTDDWITNVTFNTINNTTGNEGDPCSYGDYTSMSTDVQQNGTYTLSVSFESGIYTECVGAWFDWNQNFVFEESEGYDLGCGISETLTANIAIPFDALLGPTRMRVAERYSVNPTPCDDTFYGEAEDYTINIVEGAPCVVECPPEAGYEQEACGDDTNGGCNADEPTWESIQCGDIVCGTTWAENDSRDTDWYELVLTEAQVVTVSVEAEYPVAIFILDASDCEEIVFIETGETAPCTPFSISATLDIGTYTIWTGPGTGQDPIYNGIPCDGSGDYTNNYVLEVTCGPLPVAACCNADLDCVDDLNKFDCAALNGGWFEGESCVDFECVLFEQVGLAMTGNIPDCGVSNYGPLGETDSQQNTYDWNGQGPVNFAGSFVMGNSPTAMFSYYNPGITDTYEYDLTGFLQMGDPYNPTAPFGDGGVLGGLAIEYCGHGYTDPADAMDIFVHVYTITNTSEVDLTGYYAGVYFDWDINLSEDIITFDRSRNLMYQEGTDLSYLYGLCMINADDIGLTSMGAVSQWDYIYPNGGTVEGGWMMDALHMIMSSGTDQIWDEPYGDMSSIMSTGPHTIAAGASITMQIAVIGANSEADMFARADFANTMEVDPCEPVSSLCGDYVVGDYNGSGTFNVADIISAFSKLKTGTPDAALLCECPVGANPWAVAMDVNNSCAFNVADVIAGFSKLKTGAPPLVPCEECPPEGGSPRGGGDQPLIVPNLESKAKLSTGSGME